ncbi:hypothetical protein RB195_006646 [Necator americanus]|uniref:Uncharacterized protein n=1 Tax=Necator americanus TaxID=51031 RepID=A0ABR1BWJ0_NECAM
MWISTTFDYLRRLRSNTSHKEVEVQVYGFREGGENAQDYLACVFCTCRGKVRDPSPSQRELHTPTTTSCRDPFNENLAEFKGVSV